MYLLTIVKIIDEHGVIIDGEQFGAAYIATKEDVLKIKQIFLDDFPNIIIKLKAEKLKALTAKGFAESLVKIRKEKAAEDALNFMKNNN